jgi:hypothetical protein
MKLNNLHGTKIINIMKTFSIRYYLFSLITSYKHAMLE